MAKPISSITVACPRCGDEIVVPVTWKPSPVGAPHEVRLSPEPDLSAVKTHLVLHIPHGPDDGLPIAS